MALYKDKYPYPKNWQGMSPEDQQKWMRGKDKMANIEEGGELRKVAERPSGKLPGEAPGVVINVGGPSEPGMLYGGMSNEQVEKEKNKYQDAIIDRNQARLFPMLANGNRESNTFGAAVKKSGDKTLNDNYDRFYENYRQLDEKAKPAAYKSFFRDNWLAILKVFPEPKEE